MAKTYKIAVIPGDGTGPGGGRAKALKVLEAVAAEVRLQARPDRLRLRRRALPADRRDPARLARSHELQKLRRDLPRRHRPPRRQARHPREGHPAAAALRARPVHQPAPGEALPRRRDARSRTRARRTSTSSSSARTPTTSTPASAASMMQGHAARGRHADQRLHPLRGRALPPLRLRRSQHGKKARGNGKKNTLTPGRQDQRADLRLRPLGARVPRDRRQGLPRHQARLQPRRRHAACGSSRTPSGSTCIVTDNMFGDIITDLGAMIQGGMGIAAGGNINPEGVSHVRADRRLGARSTPARTSSTRSPPSAPAR